MTLELKPFDAADYLDNDEAIEAYLDAALDDGDGADFTAALDVVARAKGMAAIAEKKDATRQSRNKSSSDLGRPEFAIVHLVLRSLGMRLHVAPIRAIDTASADAPRPGERIVSAGSWTEKKFEKLEQSSRLAPSPSGDGARLRPPLPLGGRS